MASGNAVWGIDIGQCALKAIKLRPAEDGKVEAVAFDVIEHPKILSQPDADRDELIAAALEKFASRNAWQGDQFVVGVPGQQTFARFCKMPPIDLKNAKKVHDLVRYEASQQIPFDIDDVVWDYQVFTTEGSPDIEVGIFAIRKDLIRKHLGYFGAVRIAPMAVQTIPAALYNFCQFDGQAVGDGGATVLIDVGSQNTDLIIVEPNAAWTRNIPLGGNTFTEALVRAFKLSFAKAESLKRSAADSKYARQIFQAMRPVFADLVGEVQRSIGFFSSTHRGIELRKALALGNAFRLPGLQKYLENNLTIPGGVVKLEKFNKLVLPSTVNSALFTENILSFAPAYGLALQGLGLAKIRASLLPTELARIAIWQRKRPYFIATAAAVMVAAGIPWIANGLDKQALESNTQARDRITRILSEARNFRGEYEKVHTNTAQKENDIATLLKLQEHKRVVPRLMALVNEAMPELNPPELAQVASAEELKELIQSDPAKYDRTVRGQLIIESFKVEYVPNLDTAELGGSTPRGGISPRSGRAAPAAPTAPPAGGGGRSRWLAGGGGGRIAPGGGPAPGPQAELGGGGPAGKPANAGLVVRVQGRLLYGRSPADAVQWLTQNYFERLREFSQQPGLGFHIPPDDPQQGKTSIVSAPPVRYHQAVGPGGPLTGGPTPSGAQLRDPVTGEDTSNDWKVEFAFKVKLGEAPKPKTEPEQAGGKPGPGGGPPAASPPKPAGGRVAPPRG